MLKQVVRDVGCADVTWRYWRCGRATAELWPADYDWLRVWQDMLCWLDRLFYRVCL